MTTPIDTVQAWQLDTGDLTMIEGDLVSVTDVNNGDDKDEVIVSGTSHDTGDGVQYELYAFDDFDLYGA